MTRSEDMGIGGVTARAVFEALVEEMRPGLTLVVEDAHWADRRHSTYWASLADASSSSASWLSSRTGPTSFREPISCVSSSATSQPRQASFGSISEPLSADAVAALAPHAVDARDRYALTIMPPGNRGDDGFGRDSR